MSEVTLYPCHSTSLLNSWIFVDWPTPNLYFGVEDPPICTSEHRFAVDPCSNAPCLTIVG